MASQMSPGRTIRYIAVRARRALRSRGPAWLWTERLRWIGGGGLRIMALVLVVVAACAPASETELVPRKTLFIGVDVSGSFQKDGNYDDAMAFAARYIHGHLNGMGELEEPRALFVGSIGGETPGEPQAFHPIHDFEGKTPREIEADLREWFPADDRFTDFNAFFRRAATLVKRQNLALAPVTLVLFTDGVPDLGAQSGGAQESDRYAQIDLDPLEYLARNVTIRVLYPDPAVAVAWERQVPRDRVRMWTVDDVVMKGWRDQLIEPQAPEPVELAMAGPDEVAGASAEAGDALTEESGKEAGGDAGKSDDSDAGADEAAPDSGAGETAEAPAPTQTRPSPGNVRVEAEVIDQPALWRWIKDNVDFRVRRTVL